MPRILSENPSLLIGALPLVLTIIHCTLVIIESISKKLAQIETRPHPKKHHKIFEL